MTRDQKKSPGTLHMRTGTSQDGGVGGQQCLDQGLGGHAGGVRADSDVSPAGRGGRGTPRVKQQVVGRLSACLRAVCDAHSSARNTLARKT